MEVLSEVLLGLCVFSTVFLGIMMQLNDGWKALGVVNTAMGVGIGLTCATLTNYIPGEFNGFTSIAGPALLSAALLYKAYKAFQTYKSK